MKQNSNSTIQQQDLIPVPKYFEILRTWCTRYLLRTICKEYTLNWYKYPLWIDTILRLGTGTVSTYRQSNTTGIRVRSYVCAYRLILTVDAVSRYIITVVQESRHGVTESHKNACRAKRRRGEERREGRGRHSSFLAFSLLAKALTTYHTSSSCNFPASLAWQRRECKRRAMRLSKDLEGKIFPKSHHYFCVCLACRGEKLFQIRVKAHCRACYSYEYI